MAYKPKHLGISKQDWKYVPKDPDDGFNADHNKRVIEKTIRKYEANRRRKMAEFDQKTRERTEAITDYVQNLKQGQGESNVNKYFGRKHMAYLRGQDALAQLKRAYGKEEQER